MPRSSISTASNATTSTTSWRRFPIVKRKDIAEHGEYRTKRLILEIYDAMAEAERTGKPYQSPFDEKAATAR